MIKAAVEANLYTFGSAVSVAANMENIKQGKQIHAMILKECGSIDDAKREFLEMLEKNEISCNAMITGYSQHGCGTEAINLFKTMKQHVDLLGRAGFMSRAREFIEKMLTEQEAMIWRTLLSACRVHKNMEIGEFAANHLLELEHVFSYICSSIKYVCNGGEMGFQRSEKTAFGVKAGLRLKT
ncbi:hypothetical protein EZV62_007567 [Acer yangbiense]|uniref:Pentatricopeptide repeat-containing protein n=1 Tax=Acer yangbiense TaxID=1000413 RepID=A0A5C7IBZ6_9ROSI|nr:hypothetical protein EZV62_007567 [Acer yangbiense]